MVFLKKRILKCGERNLVLGSRTFIMGILNVTPDSFSDGGQFLNVKDAVKQAETMLQFGADIIDVGGESTRPFAKAVSVEEEMARVLPVVTALVQEGILNLSIDTRNAQTAEACLALGASWINDVSALSHDEKMIKVARNADALILMHAKGTPEKMQDGEIVYQNTAAEIADYLKDRVQFAVNQGFERDRLLVDPGIGFGKKLPHNLEIIKNMHQFDGIGAGILCGLSRKAFIGEITGIAEADKRDYATLGALTWAAFSGADIVRVHNVKAAFEALQVVDALKYQGRQDENLYQAGR